MAFVLSKITSRLSFRALEEKFISLTISGVREHHDGKQPVPRLRNPTWFIKQSPKLKDENVTPENKDFIREVIQDRFINKEPTIPKDVTTCDAELQRGLQRTGLIARKIGVYPMWLKNGKKISTTLLQILDNHVIKYYPPESYDPPRKRPTRVRNPKGCLLLGAEGADPTQFTREYCGLFKDSGVIPKKILGRFFVSPDAALQPGTLLNALHFQVGGHVDVRGKTKDRGFQGVMKRWGFKGMPASHGVTKTHRRGGNIGGGGEKGRVWPGTKMPGHMGNRYRVLKGLKIWRINTKHSVLYVSGQNIPGGTNSIVYVYDTLLPTKRYQDKVPYPTYIGDLNEQPEDIYDSEVHQFSEPTIVFDEEKKEKKS